MGAIAEAIFGDDGETVTTKTEESPEVQAMQSQLLSRATNIADRAYTPYTGERVAGLSENERQASELARTGSSEAKSYLDQAGEKAKSVQSFKDADLSSYTNPYTEAVLQPQLREAGRAYEKQKSSLLNSKAGAWGGDRSAFAESELNRNYLENVTDLTAKTHSQAFDKATQLWSQDQDRALNASTALRAVGGDISKLNTQQIQDLMATGQTERLLEQAELDFDYQQFVENRDWSVTNLQPLLQALSASKGGSVTSTQTGSGNSNGWGQALGAATTLAGMYFSNSGDGGGGDSTSYNTSGYYSGGDSSSLGAGLDLN